MDLNKEEYERLDQLIRLKATGSPQELADKFNRSKRTMQRIIEEMKKVGCPIYYNRYRRSYCYEYPGKLIIKFETLNDDELNKIKGGIFKEISSMPNSGIEVFYICSEKQINCFSGYPTPNIKVGLKFFYNETKKIKIKL